MVPEFKPGNFSAHRSYTLREYNLQGHCLRQMQYRPSASAIPCVIWTGYAASLAIVINIDKGQSTDNRPPARKDGINDVYGPKYTFGGDVPNISVLDLRGGLLYTHRSEPEQGDPSVTGLPAALTTSDGVVVIIQMTLDIKETLTKERSGVWFLVDVFRFGALEVESLGSYVTDFVGGCVYDQSVPLFLGEGEPWTSLFVVPASPEITPFNLSAPKKLLSTLHSPRRRTLEIAHWPPQSSNEWQGAHLSSDGDRLAVFKSRTGTVIGMCYILLIIGKRIC